MSNQNSDPFNPNLRRINPADLSAITEVGPKAAITAPAVPNSATPDGWMTSSLKPNVASCEWCGDVGYYMLKVAYGHAQWGKIQKCSCNAYQERLEPRAAK